MNKEVALGMLSDLFWTGILISLPVLGLTLLVGFLISIFQVITQVQDMSLSVVPKLFVAGLALLVLGPWMLRRLVYFASNLWGNIPLLFR